ncbi:MAG TPA: glycosyltransferase family 8 protein [Candidatus Gastranaerophilaceae bacterium]|nr:glycosyltransferase family 8 protein [Candidatus Gastranaerophilaceae bacterium]
MTQQIPIFLASDDNYAPFVATTITSIVKNTTSFINFYVLDGGIVEWNKQKIQSIQSDFKNFSVEFVDMGKCGLERFPNLNHYSVNTFSRYFIPELKPDLDKILYLDIDIIVKGDIAQLYNQEMNDYPIAAILEDFYPENYKYLKQICPNYDGGSNYFNAGVLLISLDYFRKNNITQQLIDTTVKLKDLIRCADQDILNFVFANNFKILDYKFDFMPDHKDYIYKLGKKEAIGAIDNHGLIHYTGRKPWNTMQAENAQDFWDVAKLTPFYKELKTALDIKSKADCYDEYLKKIVLKKLTCNYKRYKVFSKLFIGGKRKRYKQKALEVKNKIDLLTGQ